MIGKIISMALLTYGSLAFGLDTTRFATSSSGNSFGIGVGFSGATGLSMYMETNRANFVQATVGVAPYDSFAISGDYAFGYHNAISSEPSITPFWGIGAVLYHDGRDYWDRFSPDEDRTETDYVGARVPLGINFVMPKAPIQVAVELAPTMILTPDTYSYLQVGASVRYLF